MIIDKIEQQAKNIQLNITALDKENIFDIMYEASLRSGALSNNINLKNYININNRVIFIAGAPKSGSTLLCGAITQILNYIDFPVALHGMNENDINLFMLLMSKTLGDGNIVARSHTKATYFTVEYLKNFNIKPIISVRNIYDTIISLTRDIRNHHLNGKRASYSFLWQTNSNINFDDNTFINMIIDYAVPWYVNFYASWYNLCQEENLDACFISYSNLIKNKTKTIENIFNFLDLKTYDKPNIENAVNKFYKNDKIDHDKEHILPLNIGKEVLTKEQILKIKEKFAYYPDIPFAEYEIGSL